STVQECKLVVRFSPGPSGLKEGAKWPITDVLYTYLRPLNIRRLETPRGRKWCILLPPSYSLYKVRWFDHTRRIVEVERIWGSRLRAGSLDYVPYKCYPDSRFNYGKGAETWHACVPEFVTYITFDMLPEADRPLLYLCCRQRNHGLEVLSLIYVSKPRGSVRSIPVTYTYDCRFVWIGVTIDDLHDMGFEEPPTNYTIEEVRGRGSRIIRLSRSYSYDDLLENTSVTRAIRSHALVKVYVEASRELGYSPQLISGFKNIGLYIRRVPKICFKKVLLGSRLRTTTTMLSSAPVFINMSMSSRGRDKSGGLGVRIVNSEGFELLFEKDIFRKFIEGIIFSDIRLFKTLLLKYILLRYCYSRSEDYYDFYAITSIILALIQGDPQNQLRNYSQALYAKDIDDAIANLKRDPKDYERFINYVVEVALYSLAHILAKVITTYVLNTKLRNFTLYVDTEYETEIDGKKGEYNVVMFLENSHEGLGFIEQLCMLISPDIQRNIVKYLIKPALQMLIDEKTGKDLCSIYHETCKRRDERLVEALCLSSTDLGQIRDYIRYLVGEWNRRVNSDFPSDFIRPLLYHYLGSVNRPLRRRLNTDAFLRNAVPHIYNVEVPFCWDSCQRCIRLRKAYLLSPIEQIFYLSKGLAVGLLKAFKDYFTPSKIFVHKTGSGLGREVLNLLSQASHEIRIMSPWLSPDIVKYIIDIAQNRGVKVRVITHPPSRDEPRPHVLATRILEKATKRLNTVKVVYNDKVHAKIIVVDDKLLITGSMNLTKHGTEINIENITICDSKAIVYPSIAEYEAQWWASLGRT
ncbi:MAG: hypothetical protein DRN04_17480, partial [Thermoprotei archaeon]